MGVEGAPADCVKLGVSELFPGPVDLIVSGINSGLNAGINVLYSGTVAAAIEGAFFRIPSIAVSLEEDPHADFEAAAELAVLLIKQVISNQEQQQNLFNINIPTSATRSYRAGEKPAIRCVPMGSNDMVIITLSAKIPKEEIITGQPMIHRRDQRNTIQISLV